MTTPNPTRSSRELIHSGCPDGDEHDGHSDGGKGRGALRNKLFDQRTIVLSEEISSRAADRVISSLLYLDSLDQSPIRLFINSPGGEADSGMAIFDSIRFASSPVQIVATGLIASAGTIIYCSTPRELRFAMPHTRIMMHQPATGVRGQASDIDIEAREIIAFRERVNVLIAEATGQPLERIQKDQHRNFWMDAQAGVEYGLVGKIIHSLRDIS